MYDNAKPGWRHVQESLKLAGKVRRGQIPDALRNRIDRLFCLAQEGRRVEHPNRMQVIEESSM